MPTLVDLFKNKIISEGPNTGKTAENAYAIQDSKLVEIRTTNPRLQSFADKINKRRKEDGLRLKETRLEQDQLGLRSISDTSKLILYGGDYFRIINGTTRSKQLMLRSIGASGAGLDDSIADKVGSAIGNLAGDKIQNLFLKKEDQVPVKLDARALGLDIAADIASRTLGRLLPEPMIPSKVADEFEKRRGKKEIGFIHEYDTETKVIKLKNRKGIPKLIDGLLKNNKDILSQTKDVLMSTAASVAGNLVSSGIKGLSSLIFNGRKNTPVGKNKSAQPTNSSGNAFLWSSDFKYSEARSIATLTNKDPELTGDLATMLIKTRSAQVAQRLKSLGTLKKSLQPNSKGGTPLLDKEEQKLKDILNAMKTVPVLYSEKPYATDNNIRKKRLILNNVDGLNTLDTVVFPGQTGIDASTNTPIDDFDFIPLKFYNIAKDVTLQFRCTITDLTENFSPSWETNKFIGNPFPFYTYSGIERSVTFGFKIFSMNLEEHQLAWERCNELAEYTHPSGYQGVSGAVVPPLLRFTLGNMYKGRECFIESLTYTIDENTPWEIGENKLLKAGTGVVPTGPGYLMVFDDSYSSKNYKLPMLINVEITLKFIQSSNNTLTQLYDYS